MAQRCRVNSKSSPPQPRRGGCAVKKKLRSHLSPRRRGGVGQENDFLTSTTPAATTASAFPSSAEEGSFRSVAVFAFIFLFAAPLMAQTPRIALEPLVSNLASPLYLTNAHDGSNRRFIIEQPGRIRVLQPGSSTPTLFLDIPSRVR